MNGRQKSVTLLIDDQSERMNAICWARQNDAQVVDLPANRTYFWRSNILVCFDHRHRPWLFQPPEVSRN